MSEQFKVGEIAIIQNSINYPQLDGEEVEILAGLELREALIQGEVVKAECYLVILIGKLGPDGHSIFHSMPHQLRRKRPPRREIDTTVSWSECAWEPMHIKLARAIEKAKEAA